MKKLLLFLALTSTLCAQRKSITAIPGANGLVTINTVRDDGLGPVTDYVWPSGDTIDFSAANLIVGGIWTPSVTPIGWINVLSYGADNTGVIDSAPAINSAIGACASFGTVYFPPGTYKMTTQVTISTNNITLYGIGAKITSDTAAHCRKFLGNSVSGLQIEGLILDGGFPSGTGVGNQEGLIELTNCLNVTITNCVFQNTEFDGIFGGGSNTNVSIYDSQFSNYFGGAIFYSTGTGAQPVQITISNNFFGNCNATTSTNFSGSIKINGLGTASGSYNFNLAGQYVINGNTIIDTTGQMGIELNGSCNKGAITGNTINGPGFGISVAENSGAVISGNSVQGCVQYGIEIAANSIDTVCTGNHVAGTNSSGTSVCPVGIAVTTSTYAQVTGNEVTNCTNEDIQVFRASWTSVVGNTLKYGNYLIYIQDSSDFNITSNNMTAAAGVGGTTTYGHMAVDSTDVTCQYGEIIGNIFAGPTSNQGLLLYANVNPITDVRVTGNQSANALSSGNTFFNIIIASTGSTARIRIYDNIGGGGGGFGGSTSDPNTSLSSPAVILTGGNLSGSTLGPQYQLFEVDTSSGNQTFVLPSAVQTAGKTYEFVKKTGDANTVAFSTTSSQTINGSTNTYFLGDQWDDVTVKSDGSNWVISSAYFPAIVTLTVGTPSTLTTSTYKSIGTLTIPCAGVWKVWGTGRLLFGSSTSNTSYAIGASTSNSAFSDTVDTLSVSQNALVLTGNTQQYALCPIQFTTTTSTSIFFGFQCTFTTSSLSGLGQLYAQRVQ